MRNHFRKPKKCELRLFFIFGTTIFEAKIYERSKYIFASTLYEQLC